MDFKTCDWNFCFDEFFDYAKSLSDEKYRDFSKKLIPGDFVMLGINIPTLKKIAKKIRTGDYDTFLKIDDRGIFELKFLKGQVIALSTDADEYERRFKAYLNSITDWSICDSFVASSKVIKKDPERFFSMAVDLLQEENEFANRVGFVIMLDYFVKDEYLNRILDTIESYHSEYRYANMALSWLLSVLYVKYPSIIFDYLKETSFSREVIRMSIRKIRDSYRVTIEDKDKLKELL